MHIGSPETLTKLYLKIANAMQQKDIEVVMNEDSGVCMVRTPDLESAKLIVLEEVKCQGISVKVNPGLRFSTIKMTVPISLDEQPGDFEYN